MPDWLGYIIGGLVAFAVGYLTYIAARRNSDQIRISKLQSRNDLLEGQKGRRDDYVNILRKHIEDEELPPAPPYPPGYWD